MFFYFIFYRIYHGRIFISQSLLIFIHVTKLYLEFTSLDISYILFNTSCLEYLNIVNILLGLLTVSILAN